MKIKAGLLSVELLKVQTKQVVQQRTKQPGMRWSIKGGQYILTLRAKEESNLWDEEVKKRILALC